MNMISLSNGTQVPMTIFSTTAINLTHLFNTNAIAFCEFVTKCRTPRHSMFGNTEEIATNLGLMENGQAQSIVRDIVLSEVTGKDFDMSLSTRLSVFQSTSSSSFFQNAPQTEDTSLQSQQNGNLQP